MNRIYLDHAATTPVHPKVQEVINQTINSFPGNPSSIHDDGRKVKFLIEESREKIAALLGREPAEIVFTSSATESINSVLKSFFFKQLPQSATFRSSTVEHHATLHTLNYLQKKGSQVVYEPVNRFGEVSEISQVKSELNSFMIVNNEMGSILPESVFQELSNRNEILHLDGVQALGKIELLGFERADFISFSGHKINGPKGAGILIVKSGIEFEPLFHGGSQERNRRAGTESVYQIAGLAEAVEIALLNRKNGFDHVFELNQVVRSALLGLSHNITINSPENGSPFILNFTVSSDEEEKIDGEALIMALDAKGISVSNGSACASGSFEPSHVLKEIGLTDYESQATLRISFSELTTREEIEIFVDVLDRSIKRMKSVNLI